MERVKLIGAIVLGILALIVMVQNRASVETDILFFSITMPRALLLLVTFALGAGTGMLFVWYRSRK